MKTRIKNLLFPHVLIACICFCLICAETAKAQLGNYNGFSWEKTGNTAAIVGYNGAGGVVMVPGAIPYGGTNLTVTSIGGFADSPDSQQLTGIILPDSVTEISSEAFLGCNFLTNVVFGSGLINIDNEAFCLCGNLTGINIPTGVINIGAEAFMYCSDLASVGIPNSVTNIGEEAFFWCVGATNVTIGNGVISIGGLALPAGPRLLAFTVDPKNSFYSSLGGALFDKNQTTLIAYPGGVGGSYTIPDSVTNIGGSAFQGATNLTGVTIPDSVVTIGTSAFFACYGLTNVTIPDSVTKIETQAFIQCINLASVTIGTNVASIGENVFWYCDNLQSVYFRGNAPTADSTAFNGDTNVTAYYLAGTTDWSVFSMDTGIPVALWLPQIQMGASGFGVQTNQFGFNIDWTSGQTITVEACSNLFTPDWQPIQTNTLTDSSLYFSDPQSTNYPARYYRIAWPL